jgi:fatty acid desaturase
MKIAPQAQTMAIVLTFLLGIGNFALHKAVIESRHPVVAMLPRFLVGAGGRGSMVAEFAILLAVMLLAAAGHAGWGWAYLLYSASNAFAAWLILSHRA